MAKVSLKGHAKTGRLLATTGQKNVVCPLCTLNEISKVHYTCRKFTVVDCVKCQVPMYVWHAHIPRPPDIEVTLMIADAYKRFGPGKVLDFTRRSIQDHFHFHVRPKDETEKADNGGA